MIDIDFIKWWISALLSKKKKWWISGQLITYSNYTFSKSGDNYKKNGPHNISKWSVMYFHQVLVLLWTVVDIDMSRSVSSLCVNYFFPLFFSYSFIFFIFFVFLFPTLSYLSAIMCFEWNMSLSPFPYLLCFSFCSITFQKPTKIKRWMSYCYLLKRANWSYFLFVWCIRLCYIIISFIRTIFNI